MVIKNLELNKEIRSYIELCKTINYIELNNYIKADYNIFSKLHLNLVNKRTELSAIIEKHFYNIYFNKKCIYNGEEYSLCPKKDIIYNIGIDIDSITHKIKVHILDRYGDYNSVDIKKIKLKK